MLGNRDKHLRVLYFLLMVGLGVSRPGTAQVSSDQLWIESTSVNEGTIFELSVHLDNSSGPMEAFSLAISHDPARLYLQGIGVAGTDVADTELLIVDTTPTGGDGGTVMVVLDFEAPFDGAPLPVSSDHVVATLVFEALDGGLLPGESHNATVDFVDGTLGLPTYDNRLWIEGLADFVTPTTSSASVEILPGLGDPPVAFFCGPPDIDFGSTGLPLWEPMLRGEAQQVCFYYESDVNLQGFQLAVCYDCELTVSDFSVAGTMSGAVGAEFVSYQIDANPHDGDGCELVAGILLDAGPPFDGQTVPQTTTPLPFACAQVTPRTTPSFMPANPADTGIEFLCGRANSAGSFASDLITAEPGEVVPVTFFYTSLDPLQGFQIALTYDCDLTAGSFDDTGTILDILDAEFINCNVDDDPTDGDGCEIVLGILLDLFPPFDGQMTPASSVPIAIGTIPFTVAPDATCSSFLEIDFTDFVNGSGTVPIENIGVVDFESIPVTEFSCAIFVVGDGPCAELAIDFCDGINGLGEVLLDNTVVWEFQSLSGFPTTGCTIPLTLADRFRRSDCNQDGSFDLADAAAVIGEQFFGGAMLCRDACDANDDGWIDLADAVHIMAFNFGGGVPPESPYPDCGVDPTDDGLDCVQSVDCVL